MKLKESNHYSEKELSIDMDGHIEIEHAGESIILDNQQAAELLPILEHFIKTGELPE